MGLPEPHSALWTAVKAISNPWPPDDEAHATQLASAWQQAADAMTQGGHQVTTAGAAGFQAWPDAGGATLNGRVARHAAQLGETASLLQQQATMAGHYARALHGVKTDITAVIAQNSSFWDHLPLPWTNPIGWAYLMNTVNQIEQKKKEWEGLLRAMLGVSDLPAEGFTWTGDLEDGGLSFDDLKDGKLEVGFSYKGPGTGFQTPDGSVQGEYRTHDYSGSLSIGANRDGATLGAEVGAGPSVTARTERYEAGGVSVQPEYKAQLGLGGEVSAETDENGTVHVRPRVSAGVIHGDFGIEIDPKKQPGD